MKQEYVFTELGHFTESSMKKLKEKMDGKSYMNFEVAWSNYAGNCTLFVGTDYFNDSDMSYDEQKKEVGNLFFHCVCTMC